jgi:hypothetical protein
MRIGTGDIFMLRSGGVRKYRSSGGGRAGQGKPLVDKTFPLAKKIVVVMGNLNTHTIGSWYKTITDRQGDGTILSIKVLRKLPVSDSPMFDALEALLSGRRGRAQQRSSLCPLSPEI